MAYERLHFILEKSYFQKLSFLRKKSGLQIHHGHWGLLWIFISSIWLIFIDKNIYIILLAGFGWGLLMDEIIPSLRTPSNNREEELKIYKGALKPTLVLITCMVALFICLFAILD
jgi:hypothetical protein